MSTGGIAGESIAAGMAGVVAVRLQKKQQSKKTTLVGLFQNYGNKEEEEINSYKTHHCTIAALLP